jgi:hypothetical protein
LKNFKDFLFIRKLNYTENTLTGLPEEIAAENPDFTTCHLFSFRFTPRLK